MHMALEWSRFSPDWYEWLIGDYCDSLANQLQTGLKFRKGSTAAQVTFSMTDSVMERTGELPWLWTTGEFSSQHGQKRNLE